MNQFRLVRKRENAVLARLPQPGNASTLGCELQFVDMNTLQVLADPIQSAISTNQKYYVIAEQCMVEAGHKGQLKGEVKAVRVLCSRNGKIPPQAFSFCTEIRHVLVENGVKIEEIPCRDVHLAGCLQFAMHKFRLSLFVKDLEPGGSTTFCFLIV